MKMNSSSIALPELGDICVVDDNPADREVLKYVLDQSNLPHKVVFFDIGSSIIKHMDSVAENELPMPALVLLDVNMPRMSGFEVLAKLRSNPSLANRPIIAMLSSSEAEEDLERAQALGADDFLVKQSGLNAYVELFNHRFQDRTSQDLVQ